MEATQSGDWTRVGRIAHALKGASSVVGARAAQQLAAEVESLSRGGPQERLASLTRELDRELGRAVEFLATQTPVRPR
jgi:HPt (histidine-containing phosphotransfer) domain-containing protein